MNVGNHEDPMIADKYLTLLKILIRINLIAPSRVQMWYQNYNMSGLD